MHPGIISVLVLLGTAGAIVFGTMVVAPILQDRDVAPEETAAIESEQAEPLAVQDDSAPTADEAPVIEEAAVDVPTSTNDVADASEPTNETVGDDLDVLEPEPTPPVFDVVRVEPNGDVLVAGNAEDANRVGLTFNQRIIAEADVLPGGDFVLTPTETLPIGEGMMGIVILDEDGNTAMRSEEQVAVVLPGEGATEGFLVSILRPGEAVEILERQAPQETNVPAVETAEVDAAPVEAPTLEVASPVEPAVDDETGDTPVADNLSVPQVELAARVEPTQPLESEAQAELAIEPFVLVDAVELEGLEAWVAGGALPGTVIRLYQDNVLLGEAPTGTQGRFLYQGTLEPSLGETIIRADALDNETGEVVARAEVPFEMPEAVVAALGAGQSVTSQLVTQEANEAANEEVNIAPTADQAPSAASDVATGTVAEPAPEVERIAVLDTGRAIIRRGDNLWRLSRRVYGQGVRFTSIYDANREQIRDPALIFPGQVFNLPTPLEEWGDVPGFDALEPDQVPSPIAN
ncbi:MAG: LysM peptidoglycan-binding domain-containing protein [Pseudomonadota bacterium]